MKQPEAVTVHVDKHVGMCGEHHVEEINNGHGQHYFKASYTPTHLFGFSVHSAPLEGFGATREIAIARLEAEIKEFNDSLWV